MATLLRDDLKRLGFEEAEVAPTSGLRGVCGRSAARHHKKTSRNMQPEIAINYLAVALCVLVALPVGFVWFGPLFGKPWAKEMGMEDMEPPGGAAMGKSMVIYALGSLLIAWVLGLIRFRGHFPKGEYDVHDGQTNQEPATPPGV